MVHLYCFTNFKELISNIFILPEVIFINLFIDSLPCLLVTFNSIQINNNIFPVCLNSHLISKYCFKYKPRFFSVTLIVTFLFIFTNIVHVYIYIRYLIFRIVFLLYYLFFVNSSV